jgi:hypothetical protein
VARHVEAKLVGPSRAAHSGFQPLSRNEFAEIKRCGGVGFNAEICAVLNERLFRLCDAEGDALDRKHSRAARALLQRVVDGLDAALIATSSTPDGAALARWLLFRETGDRSDDVRYLESLRDNAAMGMTQLSEGTPKRGAPPNIWFEWFVICVADAYYAAGGTVSAAKTKNGGRETPFLRVVRYINSKLPPHRRAESDATTDERAASAIPHWKRWRSEPTDREKIAARD